MWPYDSIKIDKSTLASEEIKVEPPESPLNNDDTLCDTDFVSENHLIGAAEIKQEIDINYVTQNRESETSRLDSEIKIEFEETDLKKESMNEINEKPDIESLKSNIKDFENVFVQSTQELVIKKEENEELIEDPLQGVAEGNLDEGRGHLEFIGRNNSKSFQENSNNVDIKVDSDSHVLIHSERETHLEKNPLNNELNTEKLIHTSEKSHKCDICGKSFTRKTDLKKHNLVHTGSKPHKCDICGKLFRQMCHLNTHKLIHTGEKPHKCDICGKLFSQNKDLRRHFLIHTGEKPHKCDVCGKLFNLKENLKKHMIIHTGGESYKCEICGKLFTRKEVLKKHYFIHTDEKPHKCDICGKVFKQICHLNTHKVVHTGEKRHKCDICGKLFTRRFSLNTHKLMHTSTL